MNRLAMGSVGVEITVASQGLGRWVPPAIYRPGAAGGNGTHPDARPGPPVAYRGRR